MAQPGGVHAVRTPTSETRTLQEAPNTTPSPPSQKQETVTLVLRPRKKVSWDVETVDNEHMQKKSSKICCVFHKKETLEDSSDEDDDTQYKGKGKDLCHHQSDEEDDCGGHGGKGKAHCHDHQSVEVAESSEKFK
ncbi:unnamed protein product [Calypogeia fissa]